MSFYIWSQKHQPFATHCFCADLCHRAVRCKFWSVLAEREEVSGLSCVGQNASAGQVLELLEVKIKGRKKRGFTSIFAVTDPLRLREAGLTQIRQIFRAPTTVYMYTGSGVRVRE